jgi:wobble nucleotide-excising tRNase
MLFALGCIQSRRCHTNQCPTGITTQDPKRRIALNVDYRSKLVANFHRETIESFLEVLGATGLTDASELHPGVIHRMMTRDEAKSYDQIYEFLEDNALIHETAPDFWMQLWNLSNENTFHLVKPKPRYAMKSTPKNKNE